MSELKGNVGEWCELFVFISILLKYQGNFEYVVKIKRSGYEQEYYFLGEILYINGIKSNISYRKIQNIREEVAILIKSRKTSSGIIANKKLAQSLNKIGIINLKSPSTTKTDLQIISFNLRVNEINFNYYSIKSFVNSNPTVVNASTRSCLSLIFDNDIDVKRFLQNETPEEHVRSKIKQYKEYGLIIRPGNFLSQNYVSKLNAVDSKLPNLLANMIFEWLKNGTSKISENISAISTSTEDYLSNYNIFTKFILSELNNDFENKNCSIIYVNKKLNVIERSLAESKHIDNLFENLYFDMPSKYKHTYKNRTPGDIFVNDGNFITTVNYQIRLKKF